jgi:hypothetical protein
MHEMSAGGRRGLASQACDHEQVLAAAFVRYIVFIA